MCWVTRMRPRAPLHSLAIQIHLSHASGSLALRHLHPGDWLGRPDSLTLKISAGGNGTYYNPLVDAREHFIEPWVGLVDCHSEMGEITTELRVEVRKIRGVMAVNIARLVDWLFLLCESRSKFALSAVVCYRLNGVCCLLEHTVFGAGDVSNTDNGIGSVAAYVRCMLFV